MVLKFLSFERLFSLFVVSGKITRVKIKTSIPYLNDAGTQSVQNCPIMTDE